MKKQGVAAAIPCFFMHTGAEWKNAAGATRTRRSE